jgi:hypothetical protein
MSAEIRLPAEVTSVAAARQFVRGYLERAGWDDDVIDRAVLLTSELATAAATRATTRFGVRVTGGAAVRVEVTDDVPSLAVAPDRTGDPRLALYVLDGIATTWGWYPIRRGKTVWCEVVPD